MVWLGPLVRLGPLTFVPLVPLVPSVPLVPLVPLDPLGPLGPLRWDADLAAVKPLYAVHKMSEICPCV